MGLSLVKYVLATAYGDEEYGIWSESTTDLDDSLQDMVLAIMIPYYHSLI